MKQITLLFTLLLGVVQMTLAQNVIRGTVSDSNGPLTGCQCCGTRYNQWGKY